jgi:hypothetical protein
VVYEPGPTLSHLRADHASTDDQQPTRDLLCGGHVSRIRYRPPPVRPWEAPRPTTRLSPLMRP